MLISRQWKFVSRLKPDTRNVGLKNWFWDKFQKEVYSFKHLEPGMIHMHLLNFSKIY